MFHTKILTSHAHETVEIFFSLVKVKMRCQFNTVKTSIPQFSNEHATHFHIQHGSLKGKKC